ncbi:MAG: indole-3-glycerol phosphate synthase TrpC [Ignavibacteriae bacterium]|nr:indole-3-glycerol phosphate synthase TrpC [Ignavibacteriota bacterium]NOG97444.1 indole-3-glycerol phosphate synthase TrpC [Ignavibacteriota bacterium]
MKNILNDIVAVKKEEIAELHAHYTYSRFADSEDFEKNRLSLFEALKNENRISIIAEIKKASPSKGIIRKDFNHLKIAETYLENEVEAISILTDKQFFDGNIQYLNDAAKIKTVPLLRKDFIIDEFQVLEAKSNGADAILLIAEILSANQIQELTHAASEADLEVLLELHSVDQISKINFEENKIIGINNRDLSNFTVSLDTTVQIKKMIPKENLIVSESGISGREAIEILKGEKVNAVLIGEHFMSKENIADAVKEMKELCSYES